MALEFLSGLFQGLGQSYQRSQDQFEKEELKKLQVKVFKRQLEQQEKAESALSKLSEFISPQSIQMMDHESDAQTSAQIPGRPLNEVLATPEGQKLALQSGVGIKDLASMQRKAPGDRLLEALIGQMQGGGSPGNFELSGLKIGPDGQLMPDLSRPKFKDEVPSGDGMFMIQRDEYGREMGRRPSAPGERKQPEGTKGQTKADQKFADEYVEFKAAGGYADVQKQLEQLRAVSESLVKNKLTGPAIGNTPERLLKIVNPDAVAARDAVFDTAQRNLRLVLGAQFTQKEGEMLLARAYDLALPPSENKERVERLISQIETAAKAKQEAIDYFEKHGTLTGFKGKLWTLADFSITEKPSLKGPGKKDVKVVDFNSLP